MSIVCMGSSTRVERGYLKFLAQLFLVPALLCFSVLAVGAQTVESFEGAFPPEGWSLYNIGSSDPWERSTSRANSGSSSAFHNYSFTVDQDAWLITPQMSVAHGDVVSFWEYTAFSSWYDKHSLWVCEQDCLTPPVNWTELKEFTAPVGEWREQIVDLSAYAGRQVYLGFRYQGYDAAAWYVDDVVLPRGEVSFAGGEGTELDPFQIETPAQLNEIRNHLDKHFVLLNDIDLNVAPYNQGAGWAPIGVYVGWENLENQPFTGSFDGAGHTISGLFIDLQQREMAGLFALTDGATIQNLELADVDITSDHYAGSLVGLAFDTEIRQVSSSGAVLAQTRGGGLVGEAYDSVISDSESACDVVVEGGTNAGGLIGQMNRTVVERSHATGDVRGTSDLVGGLVGEARNESIISECFAAGAVTGEYDDVGGLIGGLTSGSRIFDSHASGTVDGGATARIGGLVGYAEDATIERSFATGDVIGRKWVGGLVGDLRASTVNHSHATGNLASGAQGEFFGGLAGQAVNGSVISNSYAEGDLVGLNANDVGGLIGSLEDSRIENSHAVGAVESAVRNFIGGLVGRSENGVIIDSFARGSVQGSMIVGGLIGWADSSEIARSHALGPALSSFGHVGGLIGEARGSEISKSFAMGAAQGRINVGGLIGVMSEGRVEDSYAQGAVIASLGAIEGFGGLVGLLHIGEIINAYAAGPVDTANDSGGLVGIVGELAGPSSVGGSLPLIALSYYNSDTTGQSDTGKGEPRTTAQMQSRATFDGWDFPDVWQIVQGVTHPYLSLQAYSAKVPALLAPIDGITISAQDVSLAWLPVQGPEGSEIVGYEVQFSADPDFPAENTQSWMVWLGEPLLGGLGIAALFLGGACLANGRRRQLLAITAAGAILAGALVSGCGGSGGKNVPMVELEDADAVVFALAERLDEGTTYYWRVRAIYSPSGESDWSPVWSFSTSGENEM